MTITLSSSLKASFSHSPAKSWIGSCYNKEALDRIFVFCICIYICISYLIFDPPHWTHYFPTARPSHGSGLAIIRKLLIVFSGPLASDNISWDFPTTSVSICLLWTDLSFVSICLLYPANDQPASFNPGSCLSRHSRQPSSSMPYGCYLLKIYLSLKTFKETFDVNAIS